MRRLNMPRQSVFDMKVSKVYPLLVAKAERKGRTKEEVVRMLRLTIREQI